MRRSWSALGVVFALLSSLVAVALLVAAPGPAHGEERHRTASVGGAGAYVPVVTSDNVQYATTVPGSTGISGCFMRTAPLFVVSNLDSVKTFDVSDPLAPRLVGTMPDAHFENEAMNCGERVTGTGTSRFALIGVDLFEATPGDIGHANIGGGELVVVDVTDPANPVVRSRVPGTTSTHTVGCVDEGNCRFAYSAGSDDHFSIFDLRDLDHPVELDADRRTPGTQPFASPTAGHKWNFDQARYATHTGFDGTSMWDVSRPTQPRLVTTTGAAGRGEDPAYPGWNDFIHHNSLRPNAKAFRPMAPPSVANGNVLFVTEEDYEQTDCAQAGSFQTWWVRRLDGTPDAIVPLDKVELADLGTFPVPQFAFCSAHWFDYHPSGVVAAGFYGGGTQLIDVRDPRDLKAYGHATWGVSETWDTMWVPRYNGAGVRTQAKTDVVYAIDLVRGLDVYQVDLPGDGIKLASSPAQTNAQPPQPIWLLALGLLLASVVGLRLIPRRPARPAA